MFSGSFDDENYYDDEKNEAGFAFSGGGSVQKISEFSDNGLTSRYKTIRLQILRHTLNKEENDITGEDISQILEQIDTWSDQALAKLSKQNLLEIPGMMEKLMKFTNPTSQTEFNSVNNIEQPRLN